MKECRFIVRLPLNLLLNLLILPVLHFTWLGKTIHYLFQSILVLSLLKVFHLKIKKFQPNLLNSTDSKVREPQVEIFYGLFQQMAQVSNQNLE